MSTPEHERVDVGWTFPAHGGDAEEIVAIPLLGIGDDAVPLFMALADQRAELEALADQRLIAEQQVWRPASGGG